MNKRASDSITITSALIDHASYLKGRVLDIGCGAMPYKRLTFDGVTEWVGLDVREGVGDIDADMCEMPDVADESFDTLVCVDSLQYVTAPPAALQEFYRVLMPGGRLLLVVPNSQEDDRSALWGFRIEGVRLLLLQAGFDIEAMRTASRQFSCEYDNSKVSKYGYMVPPGIEAFVQRLDDAFPHIVVAVGLKEER